MALALVMLSRVRGKKIEYFLDYISYDVASLGIQIQGEKHDPGEYSDAKIIKVFNDKYIL